MVAMENKSYALGYQDGVKAGAVKGYKKGYGDGWDEAVAGAGGLYGQRS